MKPSNGKTENSKVMVVKLVSAIPQSGELVGELATDPTRTINFHTNPKTKIGWHVPKRSLYNPPIERPKEMRLPNEGDHSLTIQQLANYVEKKSILYLNVTYTEKPMTATDIEIIEIEVMGINYNPVAHDH